MPPSMSQPPSTPAYPRFTSAAAQLCRQRPAGPQRPHPQRTDLGSGFKCPLDQPFGQTGLRHPRVPVRADLITAVQRPVRAHRARVPHLRVVHQVCDSRRVNAVATSDNPRAPAPDRPASRICSRSCRSRSACCSCTRSVTAVASPASPSPLRTRVSTNTFPRSAWGNLAAVGSVQRSPPLIKIRSQPRLPAKSAATLVTWSKNRCIRSRWRACRCSRTGVWDCPSGPPPICPARSCGASTYSCSMRVSASRDPSRHSSNRASSAETRTTPAARPSSSNSSSG